MKKFFLILLVLFSVFLQCCTTQEKMGVSQFVSEMNKKFELEMKTSDFQLGYDENNNCYLFSETEHSLTTLFLNENNQITGVSLLIIPNSDIPYYINHFVQICSVFTHTQYELQLQTLNDNGFDANKINFADGNTSVTIGKYKYTIISNAYSITLFCDRI